MNYKKRLALICTLTVAFGLLGIRRNVHAQQPQDSSYQAISDKFFGLLQQGKPEEAMDYIIGTGPALREIPEETDPLKIKFTAAVNKMGPYVARAKLTDSTVTGLFVYQHYFVAYARQPISIRIKYYKPSKVWICQGIQFDADVSEFIQKAADAKFSGDFK